MASPSDNISMALFCDFENVALGVRDAQYEKFDIKPILERLLLKGSIVVKKAYCDWERYKGFKATMHEANFELIEIPHVRQSGKNSADIRLVVDALDLCYTKSHVNTFVIISGDSDFSPLVSKLRENAKQVIGVGVKQSTSDLLIANCDEFIFYDDLVRENQRAQARRQNPGNNPPAPRRTPEEERHRKETQDARRTQGVELAVETFEALLSERGDTGKIWASVLKEAIKRRKPDFSEGRYGFRTFGNLLEEAQARGLLEFGRDEKSGAYVFRSHGAAAAVPAAAAPVSAAVSSAATTTPRTETSREAGADRAVPRSSDKAERNTSRVQMQGAEHSADAAMERPPSRYFSQPTAPVVAAVPAQAPNDDDAEAAAHSSVVVQEEEAVAEVPVVPEPADALATDASRPARGRGRSGAKAQAASTTQGGPRTRRTAAAEEAAATSAPAEPVAEKGDADQPAAAKKPARPRSRARKAADE
ncbi:NYN domain-containing protein [Acidovorax sp. DW039]|uniref:NYN domain-containing protein n=1 Tax=Acidovorax sp. DW039 TaxID=3095606 RepID=UPI003093C3F5|nr:NYN domain-containing protein [Acidovorax sp. DW039]